MRDLVMAVHWLRRAMAELRGDDTDRRAAVMTYGFAWKYLGSALCRIDWLDNRDVRRLRQVEEIMNRSTHAVALRARSVDHV